MGDFSIIGGDSVKIETFAEVTASSNGTLLQVGATPNVKSGYTELIASTSFDYNEVMFNIRIFNGGHLFDIAIGAASSEQVVIPNVLLSLSGSESDVGYARLQFPITIPAGTRIAIRSQSETASASFRIVCIGVGNSFTSSEGVSKITVYGASTTDSGGTGVDPGGVANTKGSYSQVVASTGEDIKGFYLNFGDRDQAKGVNDFLFDIAIGAASSEQVIVSNYHVHTHTTEITDICQSRFFPISLPAGTRIAVRSQSNEIVSTERILDVVIYGVV